MTLVCRLKSLTAVCKWSVNGMVRENGMVYGDSLTLDCEWNGLWRKKMKIQQIIISYKIYNPGMLLFLTTEFGVEFG